MARVVDQRDHGRNIARRPIARHQLLARRSWVRCTPDQCNDLIDIGNSDGQADQHVRPLARLAQEELGAATDHLLAEVGEGSDQVLEVELFRASPNQGHYVGAEGGLHDQDEFVHGVGGRSHSQQRAVPLD